MTVWEKAILNMEQGFRKTVAVASVFSDRMKTEIVLARLRIKVDDVQSRINELHRTIGRKIADLGRSGSFPKTTEQLLNTDEIHEAMTELADREREVADLRTDISAVHGEIRDTEKDAEDSLK